MLSSPLVLLTLLVSVGLSALAQVCLKTGMISPGVQSALAGDSAWQSARAVATSAPVVGGLLLYGLGAMLWLYVLAKVELSQAYPFVGLSFIVTAVAGTLLFQEAMTLGRGFGTVLVVAGVILVARS